MSKYFIKLINTSPSLDLTKKKKEFEYVLRDIKSLRVGLLAYQILNIETHSITIVVKEVNDRWHQKFGNLLANEYTMRRFCDTSNSSRMFKWQLI